jgi:hypothetical protein
MAAAPDVLHGFPDAGLPKLSFSFKDLREKSEK